MLHISLKTAKWKYGKKFVYSVTYDEGLADLLKYTIPVHAKYNIPGCVAVVASQIGQKRNLPSSSYHGMWHMSATELKEIMSGGWSVANHSMTHGYMKDNPYLEVVESKKIIEDLIGVPITAFIVPNHNEHHPPVVPLAKTHGYLSVYTITDALNTYATDRFALNRTTMVQRGFAPFFTEFDPYHRLHQALEAEAWIVEYSHLTNPVNISLEKDLKQADLVRRFEKLNEVAEKQFWAATPQDVVDYMHLNESTRLSEIRSGENSVFFSIDPGQYPPQVQNHELTLQIQADFPLRNPELWVGAEKMATQSEIVSANPTIGYLTFEVTRPFAGEIRFTR